MIQMLQIQMSLSHQVDFDFVHVLCYIKEKKKIKIKEDNIP